eukprot:CAMPEP_0119099378 /NCGR_PEP_ID=MMETSP1178-20130426/185061_1 /TAXON_ID=33656 /ORGANISM="unid sp, Strain CCMP2000" /LENGTH=86 /DNA_ID=CAMNT_0007083359 /DNA_START=34 /DNA_END=294 /DNA_ORIENTATION=-
MVHAPGPRNAAAVAELARETELVSGPRKRQASTRLGEPSATTEEPLIGTTFVAPPLSDDVHFAARSEGHGVLSFSSSSSSSFFYNN